MAATAKNTNDPYYFDEAAADRAVKFIETFCTHVEGELAGTPFILADFQKEIIRTAFGTKRKSDNLRRYRFVYFEVPKKNAKSTLGAAIALYLLVADGEPGAQVFSAAGDREQARIVFRVAQTMIENNKRLSKALKKFKNSIIHPKSNSFYQVLSADAKTKHGPNVHGLVFDELHVQPNSELYDTLTKGIVARRQPMVWMITTAGYQQTFAEDIHNYALGIQNGSTQSPDWLVRIFAANQKDDPFDPVTWRKANPLFGVSVKEDYFHSQVVECKKRPSNLSAFLRLHLNIWTGTSETWISREDWRHDSADPFVPFRWHYNTASPEESILEAIDDRVEELRGRPCFGGLDLASVRDLASFSLFFPAYSEYLRPAVLNFFWCPRETILARVHGENSNYDAWVREGLIFPVSGGTHDHDNIEWFIKKVAEIFDLRGIAYDRWNSSQLVKNLSEDGAKMYGYGQGYASISFPASELERMLVAKELEHWNNPVMDWQMGNVKIVRDSANNIKPDKAKSADKIDGVMAKIMALGLALAKGAELAPSSYETKGLTVIGGKKR